MKTKNIAYELNLLYIEFVTQRNLDTSKDNTGEFIKFVYNELKRYD